MSARIDLAECDPNHRNHCEAQYTAFRANRASGEPIRAVQRRTEQVTAPNRSAVGHGVKKSLTPIPSGVKAHGKPEIAGAPQGETKEEADQRGRQRARPMFALVAQVNQTEAG